MNELLICNLIYVVEWWTGRLRKLQQDTGLDSFKFDAGESNWLPAGAQLNNDTDSNLWPNLYTTKYVETCSTFGGLIETRVAHQNQVIPLMNVEIAKRYFHHLSTKFISCLRFFYNCF